MDLAGATWPEIERTGGSQLLVVPVGSLEQHGPHLPLSTDTVIAEELARRLAAQRADTVIAPAVPFGASGEHAGFPGTMVVRHEVLADLLAEIVRSARSSFAGVIFVSGHGGNGEALAQVEKRCREEGDSVLTWSAATPGGDAHAGRTETSLMLALQPSAVRVALAAAGCTTPLAELMPQLRAEGVRPVSSNGVLGDPAGANADEGHEFLRSMSSDLCHAVDVRWPQGVQQ